MRSACVLRTGGLLFVARTLLSRVAVPGHGETFRPAGVYYFSRGAPAIIENSFNICICFRFSADKITAEASFTGEEFLKYTFDGNTEGDAFVLHFKTKQPAGLLYHMGKCHGRRSARSVCARRKYTANGVFGPLVRLRCLRLFTPPTLLAHQHVYLHR